jgi:hypothetical protein
MFQTGMNGHANAGRDRVDCLKKEVSYCPRKVLVLNYQNSIDCKFGEKK